MSEKRKDEKQASEDKMAENTSEEMQVGEASEETAAEPTQEEALQAVFNQQLQEIEDKYLRARAEIANMNNRFKNERELLVRYRSQDLAKKLLPAIDNLERALATEVKDEQGANLKKGIQMVLDSLQVALKEEGIVEIQTADALFDPNLHQAVQTVPADDTHPAETIVEVLQKGYQLHDRVLRPSMVIVAQ